MLFPASPLSQSLSNIGGSSPSLSATLRSCSPTPSALSRSSSSNSSSSCSLNSRYSWKSRQLIFKKCFKMVVELFYLVYPRVLVPVDSSSLGQLIDFVLEILQTLKMKRKREKHGLAQVSIIIYVLQSPPPTAYSIPACK